MLGMADAAKLLGQTLDEETKTDKALTGLADSFANQQGESRLNHDAAAPADRRGFSATRSHSQETIMGRGILLWLLGIPIPIIILILLFWH